MSNAYIPGSFLRDMAEFEEAYETYFPGEPLWVSAQGPGDKPPSEAYPFAQLDLPCDGYATPAAPRRSLCAKLGNGVSPFGTPLHEIARRELGMPVREGWDQAPDGWGGEAPQTDGIAAKRRVRKGSHGS